MCFFPNLIQLAYFLKSVRSADCLQKRIDTYIVSKSAERKLVLEKSCRFVDIFMYILYCLGKNNCEHFATWTRNGTAQSDQVQGNSLKKVQEMSSQLFVCRGIDKMCTVYSVTNS